MLYKSRILTACTKLKILIMFSICLQDLEIVYSYLHGMEALSNLREHQLRYDAL